MKFPRSTYIPRTYTRILEETALGIEVYASEDGRTLMYFVGKGLKPRHHYTYRHAERAQENMARIVETYRTQAEAKKERVVIPRVAPLNRGWRHPQIIMGIRPDEH